MPLAWPAHDRHCRAVIDREATNIAAMLDKVPLRRAAIQAGGNVGVVPATLAAHFARVLTFEPEPQNFDCLIANVTAPNVIARRCGLSDSAGAASVDFRLGNAGAHQLVLGKGPVETVTIDSLEVADCDFLQLDIEGLEALAVLGAADTIERSSPVICLEMKGLGVKYGWPDERLADHMRGLGYIVVHRVGRDVLWSR